MKLHPKIRYAGVYNTFSGKVYDKMQKGITRLFDDEQTQDSLIKAYMRWKTREAHSSIIGEPIYSLTKYDKVTRATMPCGKDALLMVSTENDLELNEILDTIIGLREKYDDKSYDREMHRVTLNF